MSAQPLEEPLEYAVGDCVRRKTALGIVLAADGEDLTVLTVRRIATWSMSQVSPSVPSDALVTSLARRHAGATGAATAAAAVLDAQRVRNEADRHKITRLIHTASTANGYGRWVDRVLVAHGLPAREVAAVRHILAKLRAHTGRLGRVDPYGMPWQGFSTVGPVELDTTFTVELNQSFLTTDDLATQCDCEEFVVDEGWVLDQLYRARNWEATVVSARVWRSSSQTAGRCRHMGTAPE